MMKSRAVFAASAVFLSTALAAKVSHLDEVLSI
jgi:hypothetical protein